MIPHLQTIFSDQEDGVPGDCLRTAFAALLDLPTARVPHFALFGEKWRAAILAWVESRNQELTVYTDLGSHEALQWRLTAYPSHPAGHANILSDNNRPADALVIAIGLSSNVPMAAHAVLWQGPNLVHDVHPLRRGLASPPWLYLAVSHA